MTPSSMTRRKFLAAAGGVGVAAAASGLVWDELLRGHVEHHASKTAPTKDRVLIAIQLMGGNDGLNAVVPSDGRYHDARPTLGIAENKVVPLSGTTAYGLHPSLAPLSGLWKDGHLAIVDGIGFAGLSRSHFQAMDWWYSGIPNQSTTGWIGRWLDATATAGDNPLRAVAMGGTAQAFTARKALSTSLTSPSAFRLLAPQGASADQLVAAFQRCGGPTPGDPQTLAAARLAVPATIGAVHDVARVTATSASASGANGNTKNKATNPLGKAKGDLTDQLQTAAQLIQLDLGVRVIGVVQNGYDTHADQAARQGDLLGELATSVATLFKTLEANGHLDRVMVMTWSEFGRRVAENGSGGTDHGAGGAQFLMGNAVHGSQVVGSANLAHLQEDADVAPGIDARSLYATSLDWLGGPSSEVLGRSWDTYGLLKT